MCEFWELLNIETQEFNELLILRILKRRKRQGFKPKNSKNIHCRLLQLTVKELKKRLQPKYNIEFQLKPENGKSAIPSAEADGNEFSKNDMVLQLKSQSSI